MQITREDLNPCTVQLSVVCSKEQVQESFEKSLKQLAKRVKLPGFRPGHAPKNIVEKYIDERELAETAAENLVRSAYKKALEQEKIEPDTGSAPAVDLKVFDKEKGECEFTVKIPLPPKVELGDYKGLPLEKPKVEVTDEEIDYQIEEIRKRRSTHEPIKDRGVKEGDAAVLNVKVEGKDGDGRNFMTIAGQTFPQLDQAIMGMKVEDMKTVDLTFPENFQEKDWAGKLLKCQVTLNSLNAMKLPDLDDEFAKSLQTENVDQLRERIGEQVKIAKSQMIQEVVADQLFDRLLERSTIEVPDTMWENLAERRIYETEEEQKKQGKTLEQYAQENGMSVDELKDAWRDKAKQHVMRALAIREIFTAEKMSLSNAELNQTLHVMAAEFNMEPQALLDVLKKNESLEEIHFRSITRKVTEFLEQNAETKEVVSAGEPQ